MSPRSKKRRGKKEAKKEEKRIREPGTLIFPNRSGPGFALGVCFSL
jgi:hypothetical protein